jgi:hypothetical protein
LYFVDSVETLCDRLRSVQRPGISTFMTSRSLVLKRLRCSSSEDSDWVRPRFLESMLVMFSGAISSGEMGSCCERVYWEGRDYRLGVSLLLLSASASYSSFARFAARSLSQLLLILACHSSAASSSLSSLLKARMSYFQITHSLARTGSHALVAGFAYGGTLLL